MDQDLGTRAIGQVAEGHLGEGVGGGTPTKFPLGGYGGPPPGKFSKNLAI